MTQTNDEDNRTYCKSCGQEVNPAADFCRNCGVAINPMDGEETPPPPAAAQLRGGPPPQPPGYRRPKEKTVAGILAILLGGFGAHKFYLGYTGPALLFLLLTVCTCGLAGFVTGPIALIEGILYLIMSDEEFEQTYVIGRKPFF